MYSLELISTLLHGVSIISFGVIIVRLVVIGTYVSFSLGMSGVASGPCNSAGAFDRFMKGT